MEGSLSTSTKYCFCFLLVLFSRSSRSSIYNRLLSFFSELSFLKVSFKKLFNDSKKECYIFSQHFSGIFMLLEWFYTNSIV